VVAAVFVLGAVGTGIQGIRPWRRLGDDTGFAKVSITAGALGLASTQIWVGTRPALVMATAAIATGLAAIVGARRGRADGYGRAVTGVGLGLSTYVLVAIHPWRPPEPTVAGRVCVVSRVRGFRQPTLAALALGIGPVWPCDGSE
jgi:hypothetical protein